MGHAHATSETERYIIGTVYCPIHACITHIRCVMFWLSTKQRTNIWWVIPRMKPCLSGNLQYLEVSGSSMILISLMCICSLFVWFNACYGVHMPLFICYFPACLNFYTLVLLLHRIFIVVSFHSWLTKVKCEDVFSSFFFWCDLPWTGQVLLAGHALYLVGCLKRILLALLVK